MNQNRFHLLTWKDSGISSGLPPVCWAIAKIGPVGRMVDAEAGKHLISAIADGF